ncbi:MAG: aminodeoxychorismate synthase component I [candidate division Zixibacteria bacterium]|nr:aminodeoxychorismate synthase component I [candidate division Zixibacteria bacterium]MDH3936765.1 aminodeoxychorismate synthase component I [candidate division Zixibacteria bacterium]MDH4032783.1 aminodeoxychorismate synthase component I [candidate division Zixibacteria bacterium]
METEIVTKEVVSSPEAFFATVAGRPGSVWLDSTLRFDDRGHNSFVAGDPQIDVALHENRVQVRKSGEAVQVLPGRDIWDELSGLWESRQYFSVGYISYEAMLPFVGVTPSVYGSIPSVRFLFFDRAQKFDHTESVGANSIDDAVDQSGGECLIQTSRADYIERIRAIKDHIREGDIYQANFTTRIDVNSDAPPFDVYRRLRRLNPAPYSAYLDFGDYQILSTSPERMFLKEGGRISTGPIKGTIAASDDPMANDYSRRRLLESDKDRAELLMIVDLERNDLGRIARTGTVEVERLFKTETYSSLIHLVSDISAELRNDVRLKDIVATLMPGGSITGAPKKRAVEIIADMETLPRSVYTGCIGYVDGDKADFNIAIRTMIHAGGQYQVHAGGGIVADSDPDSEYDEMLLKARNLLKSLGVQQEETVC